MEWAKKIEDDFDFINFVTCVNDDIAKDCKGWTAKEAQLIYNGLSKYILGNEINDGTIYIIRTDSNDYAGQFQGYPGSNDSKWGEIRISDKAWHTPPAMGMQDVFDYFSGLNNNFFKGTLAHELTHAAVWFHPELMDQYRKVRESLSAGENFLIHVFTGVDYDWDYYDENKDDPVRYALLVDGEWMAMGVASSMYDDWFGSIK